MGAPSEQTVWAGIWPPRALMYLRASRWHPQLQRQIKEKKPLTCSLFWSNSWLKILGPLFSWVLRFLKIWVVNFQACLGGALWKKHREGRRVMVKERYKRFVSKRAVVDLHTSFPLAQSLSAYAHGKTKADPKIRWWFLEYLIMESFLHITSENYLASCIHSVTGIFSLLLCLLLQAVFPKQLNLSKTISSFLFLGAWSCLLPMCSLCYSSHQS